MTKQPFAWGVMIALIGLLLLLLAGCDSDDDNEGNLTFGEAPNGTQAVLRVDLDDDDAVLTQVVDDGTEPFYQPFGERIAFVRGRNIFTIRDNGTDLNQVTDRALGTGVNDPTFNLDGSIIAFTSSAVIPDPTPEIRTVSVNGGTESVVVANGTQPTFNPDDDSLAFVRDGDIFTVNLNGTGVTNVTSNAVGVTAAQPVFSNDGERIYYVETTTVPGAVPVIRSIRLDGTDRQTVVQDATTPAIRRSSSRLAFVRNNNVFTADIDGANVSQVTTGSVADDESLSWGNL